MLQINQVYLQTIQGHFHYERNIPDISSTYIQFSSQHK